jgi:hypothetical protein
MIYLIYPNLPMKLGSSIAMAKPMVNLPFSLRPGATGRCAGLSDGLRGEQSQVARRGRRRYGETPRWSPQKPSM